MPFTLAHPAAVLPLRRCCPRYLNFPALVIGAMVPDVGYFLGRWSVPEFSHSFYGSFGFGLPVGIGLLVLFYGLRLPVVGILPKRLRQTYFPLCLRPAGPPWIAAVSILLGDWTHLLLDSFTHESSWLVAHVAFLQTPVFRFGYYTFRMCHLAWYLCSFAGIAWLWFAHEQWRETALDPARRSSTGTKLRNALLVAGLLLPVAAVATLVRGWLGLVLGATLVVLMLAAFGRWRMNAA